MPATPEEIEAIADEVVADGVQNVSVDGQSVTALDPLKIQEIADRRRAQNALDGSNPNGGSRSGWNQLRPARFSPAGPGQ